MKPEILDTNVLLRFLVGDVPAQQQQAISWFKEAEEGKREVALLPLVVAEACFVLETRYQKTHNEIADALEVFLGQRWLRIEEREVLTNVWQWYRKGLHFVDSYLLSWAHARAGSVLTFDKEMGKKSVV